MVNIFGIIIPDLFFTILIYSLGIIVPLIAVMIVAYKRRNLLILGLTRTPYFFADIQDELGNILRQTILIKELIKVGKATYFKSIGGSYWVRESITIGEFTYQTLERLGNISRLRYDYGIPEPKISMNVQQLAVAHMTQEQIDTYMILSGKETSTALDAKIIDDIMKSVNSIQSKLIIIGIIGMLAIGVVNIYLAYSINSQFGSLINQLNTLLSKAGL